MTNRQDDSGALRERLKTLATAMYADGDEWNAYDLLMDAAAALSPQGSEPAWVGDVWQRAVEQVKEESLFCDGVSADLHSAGIDTIEGAFMEGRKSVFMEIELEVASRKLATPAPAQQAVTDGLPAHVQASAKLLLQRLDGARCDREAVSCCVRCNTVVVARHLLGIKPPPLRLNTTAQGDSDA